MSRQHIAIGRNLIVYDDELISHIDAEWFEPSHWPDAEVSGGTGSGRGRVLFVAHAGHALALRHYRRGGIIRHLTEDRFVWTGLARTRPFREWSLLACLHALDLPVPRPFAARVRRNGLLYTGDLLTLRLPGVVPLSRRLAEGSPSPGTWPAIGELLARFHAAGVNHADLNAHNIQIDADDALYLLDFDRGRVMNAPGRWCLDNLERLRRSFRKLDRQNVIRFADSDWTQLIESYRTNIGQS